MFNITSNMLLESTDSLFSDARIANSKITNENYFDTALETASSIEAEYTDAKAKLYNGLASSTKEFKDMFSKAYTRSFPEKDEKYVGESCTSTEHFISFFGKSVQILNKAAGNIADSCNGICNQAPVVAKEAAKTIGEQSKSDLCPVCKNEPCTCKKREQLFKFTTDHGMNIVDFNFPKMDDAIAGKDSFKSMYDSMVVEAADVAAKRRGALAGLSKPVDMSLFGEAAITNFRSTNRYPVQVNHRYLDYCIETVNSYLQRVNEMKSEVKRVAKHFQEAANKVADVMTASSTMEYIKEDGNAVRLECDEDVQNMDLYCKAKVDELVAGCMEHIICIGAKLDAMKCEYDQCKAILSKYVCGNDEPVALPPADVTVSIAPEEPKQDDSPAPASDGVTSDGGAIQEDPNGGDVDYTAEYESYMPGVLDIGDTRDMEDYRTSYASFLSDMITHEAELSAYINGDILNESDQVFIEGAIGKTKGLLHRISEFIKKIWGKFKNAMAGLFQNDQKYLTANENTIKNVKPKSAKIDGWYNYDRKLITNDNTLNLLNKNMNTLIAPGVILTATTKGLQPDLIKCGNQKNGLANTFKMYFNPCDNPKENNTNDKFRTYFRKYPVSINASTLTDQERAEMYDYCFNFKQGVQDVLQKDIDTVEEMRSNAEQAMQNLMDAVEKNEANIKAEQEKKNQQAQQQQNQQQQSQQQNQNVTGTNGSATTGNGGPTTAGANESVDISSVIDRYFTEDGLKFGAAQDTQPKNGNMQGTTATNAVNGSDKVDQINQGNAKMNQGIANGGNPDASKDNAQIVERYISNAFSLAKDYTAIKLSMAQNAYQQYMSFFRWHVGQYAGTQQQQQQGGNNIDTSQATVNNGGNQNQQQNNDNGTDTSNNTADTTNNADKGKKGFFRRR